MTIWSLRRKLAANFINVLLASFSFEILVPKIKKLCFVFEVLVPKISYKKRARTTLMKMTLSCCSLIEQLHIVASQMVEFLRFSAYIKYKSTINGSPMWMLKRECVFRLNFGKSSKMVTFRFFVVFITWNGLDPIHKLV